MSNWVFIASTDIVDSETSLAGFNLNGIAWQGAANDRPLDSQNGIDIVMPEMPTASQPSLPQVPSFLYWAFEQDAPTSPTSKIKFEAGKEITWVSPEIQEETIRVSRAAVRELLKNLIDSRARFDRLQDNDTADTQTVLNDSSLTSVIGGLSQKGYPLSFELGLSHWLKAPELKTIAGSWLVVAPRLDGYEIPSMPESEVRWVSLNDTGGSEARRVPVVTLKYTPTAPAQPAPEESRTPIILKVTAVAVKQAAQLLPNFIGESTTLNAAELSNWRHNFPHLLGRFLDLASIRLLMTKTDEFKKEKRNLDFMAGALALAHDRADLGLRVPLWNYTAEEVGKVDRVKGRQGRGSLAWEIILGLLLKMRGAKESAVDEGNASKIVQAAFSAARMPLGWPPPADKADNKADKADRGFVHLLHEVLRDMPGGSSTQNTSPPEDATKSPYPELQRFLAVMVEAPADKFHDDSLKDDLLPALEQLHSFMSQDEALKRLFARQWDACLKTLDKNLRQSFEEDTPMTRRLGDIDAWAQEKQVSLAQAYADGLAGSLLITHGFSLPEPIEQKAPAQPSVSNEVQYAQVLLKYLLTAYRDVRAAKKGGALADDISFIALPKDVELQKRVLPTEDQIDSIVHKDLKTKDEKEEGTLRDWRRAAWAKVLTGEERAEDPVTTSPPILIPGPAKGFDANRFSGVLVFCRRRSPDKKTEWYLLNVGDLIVPGAPPKPVPDRPILDAGRYDDINPEWRLEDDIAELTLQKPLVGHYVVPVPLGCGQQLQFALRGAGEFIEYRGRPLGVLLWESLDQWYHRGGQAESWEAGPAEGGARVASLQLTDDTLKLLNRQIIGEEGYDGWGPVPSLRYDKEFEYDFLFCPVHSTGALPALLRAAPEKPGTLASRAAINKVFTEDRLAKHIIKVSNYVRKVPVGAPRLLMPKDAPGVPADVVLCATDLRPALEADYLDKLNKAAQTPIVPDPTEPRTKTTMPQAPAHTVLLWKNGETGDKNASKQTIDIFPPSINVEEWAIWMASMTRTPPEQQAALVDLISDVQRMVREIRTQIANAESELGDLRDATDLPSAEARTDINFELVKLRAELATLLDDPAVSHVYVRKRRLFPTRETNYKFVASLEFPQQMTLPEAAEDPSLDRVLNPKERTRLRDLVGTSTDPNQKRHSKKIVLHQVEHEERIQDGQKSISIQVPDGEVWEIELIPCVLKTEWEQRFGLHRNFKPTQKLDVCLPDQPLAIDGEYYGILSGVLRIWAESAPDKPILPTPDQVWHSLRLGRVGEFSHQPPMEVLEAAVIPGKNEVLRWAHVSSVKLTLQQWYWRGLPEDGYEELATMLDETKAAKAVAVARDSVGANIVRLRQGEAPGWAERSPADADSHDVTINYAAWHLADSKAAPPATELYSAPSREQPQEPRHFLAKLQVWSRYRGLGGEHAKGVESLILVDKAGDAENPVENWRRITFRGRLRDELPVPRIKLVLPLMDWLPGEKSTDGKECPVLRLRPGFLAISRGSLPSPFHRLKASVAWTKLETVDEDGVERSKALLNIGPDPITSPLPFDWNLRDYAKTLLDAELDGKACGLTYEREAATPAFPNTGFAFPAPVELAYPGTTASSSVYKEALRTHDWFVQMNFRWQIAPAFTMDPSAKSLASKNVPWQLRLVAPMDSSDLWRLKEEKENRKAGLESGSSITFSMKDGKITFKTKTKTKTDGGDIVEVEVEVEPDPQTYPENKDESVRTPVTAYLFATWSLVPDLLTPEPSKAAHSLFLYYDDPNNAGHPAMEGPLEIYKAPHAALPDPKGTPLAPHGGNMLRLFTHKHHLADLADSLKQSKKDRLETLMDWLFPDAQLNITDKNRVWRDAKGTIIRCSEPILHETGR